MLETMHEESNKIDSEDVDKVIDLLYLSQSDTPPIDHIKDLLNDNHDIVNILLSIKQDRSSFNITDMDKNKLYLYGIIDVIKNNQIKVKNKVIDTVLNEEYLKSILYTSKTSFQIAFDYYQNNDYQLSLNEFLKCIELKETTKEEKKYSYYYIGICQYQLSNYQLALDSFDNANFNKETEGKIYYQKELDKGICFLWLGDYDNALKQYDKALKFQDTTIQISAFINRATVHIYDKNRQDENEILANLDSAISLLTTNKDDIERKYYDETMAKAYFNKASFFTRTEEYTKAIALYKKIIDMDGIAKYKPNVLLELIKLDKQNIKSYLSDIYTFIKNHSLKLEVNNDVIDFSINSLSEYIYNLIINKEDELLKVVLNYSQNTYEVFKSKCNVLAACANIYYKDRDKSKKFYLQSLKYQSEEIGSKVCYREVCLNLVYIYYQDNNYTLLKQYTEETIELFIDTQDEHELNYNHYTILSIIFDELIKHRDYSIAQVLFTKVKNKIIDKIPKKYLIFKAILLDKMHTLSISIDDKKNLSKECISILRESADDLVNFDDSLINYTNKIKKRHTDFLFSSTDRVPYINNEKIGRNETCHCGSGKKYKKCCGK
jgi:tetratricopeptide (TPR) repeat protein